MRDSCCTRRAPSSLTTRTRPTLPARSPRPRWLSRYRPVRPTAGRTRSRSDPAFASHRRPTSRSPRRRSRTRSSAAFNPAMKSDWEPAFSDIVGDERIQDRQGTPHLRDRGARRHADDPPGRTQRPTSLPGSQTRRTARFHPTPRSIPTAFVMLPSAGPYYVRRPTPPAKGSCWCATPTTTAAARTTSNESRSRSGCRPDKPSPQVEGRHRRLHDADYASGSSGLTGSLAAERHGSPPTTGPAAQQPCAGVSSTSSTLSAARLLRPQHPPAAVQRRASAPGGQLRDRPPRAGAAGSAPGQPLPDQPTDHYLPPGMPGYRDAHVYPPDPRSRQSPSARHGQQRPDRRPLHVQLLAVPGAGADRQDRPRTDRPPTSRSRPFTLRDLFSRRASPARRSISRGVAGSPTIPTRRRC